MIHSSKNGARHILANRDRVIWQPRSSSKLATGGPLFVEPRGFLARSSSLEVSMSEPESEAARLRDDFFVPSS